MNQEVAYYHLFSTALGTFGIGFNEGAFPIKRVFLPGSGPDSVEKLAIEQSLLPATPPAAVLDIVGAIRAFSHGRPIITPWERLDLRPLTPLQRAVLKAIEAIPHGQTRTYGHIASQIGRPKAARFVGTALRKNPFPIVIPCHRVIRADGSLGSFAGSRQGTPLKRRLLNLERKRTK